MVVSWKSRIFATDLETKLNHLNTYNMEHSYFRITLKQTDKETVFMVRSDKVSEFFNNKIDYLQGDCSITVKGRFPTHKDSRKWFVISTK